MNPTIAPASCRRRHAPARVAAWAICSVLAVPCAAQTAPQRDPEPAPDSQARRGEVFTDSEEHWYDLDAPTSTDYELDDIFAPHTPMFRVPPLDDPINALIDAQRRLEAETGLRVGLAYTQVYQQATGGRGPRWGMSADADLFFDWALAGRNTPDVGRLVFSVEERFRFASKITPGQLGGQIGSLVGTGGPFNDRGPVIRDAHWDQHLFDARLRLLVGRAAADDHVGAHRLASANFAFFNASVAGNPTMAFAGGHGPLALVSAHPTDLFYATIGGANAYSLTTKSSIGSLLDEGRVYGFGEVGVTPSIDGLGRGRYAITAWNMPARERNDLPSDWGFSITAEQYVAENLWFYARYGQADDGSLTGVDRHWAVAMAIDGLFGSPDNVTGFGFGYVRPANGDLRDQKSIEAFHRFQLTQHVQFSVGVQAILDPSNDPDSDAVGVFSVRLRIAL